MAPRGRAKARVRGRGRAGSMLGATGAQNPGEHNVMGGENADTYLLAGHASVGGFPSLGQVVNGIEPALLECSDGSDEETATSRKKPNLVAEGSRYGYKMPNGAFISKSNFILKVKSEIESDKYPNLKGNTWTIKLAPSARYPSGSSQEIFIPMCYAKDHRLVEAIIDKQVKGTIDMDIGKNEWKLLVRKLVNQFESDSVGYGTKKFVEMVGLQVHTLRETGKIYFVFGPDCAYKDLAPDPDPCHYWYANLSLNPRDSARLHPLKYLRTYLDFMIIFLF